MAEHYFLDTFFVQAILNGADAYHERAVQWKPVLYQSEIWVTEAVLVEVGNALSKTSRTIAADFIIGCYSAPNIHVVAVTSELFELGLSLYLERPDKEWGLTDCISFVVMTSQGIRLALTGDHHFAQAGFTPVLSSL